MKLSGLGRGVVYMDRRWREFAVPYHGHWHELQPGGGQAEVIAVDFRDVETGFVLEAGGHSLLAIASQSKQMSL